MKHGRQQKSQPAPWDARACGFTIDNFASKETTKQTICANGTNNKNIIHEHKQTDERHTNNDSQVTRPVARLRPRGAWLPSPSSMDNGPNSTDPTIVGIHPVLIRKQTSTQTKENGKKRNTRQENPPLPSRSGRRLPLVWEAGITVPIGEDPTTLVIQPLFPRTTRITNAEKRKYIYISSPKHVRAALAATQSNASR